MKGSKLLIDTAKELGYQEGAIHKESMDDAVKFMEKITDRLPQNNKHEVLYALQVGVNTMAWEIAKQAVA